MITQMWISLNVPNAICFGADHSQQGIFKTQSHTLDIAQQSKNELNYPETIWRTSKQGGLLVCEQCRYFAIHLSSISQ